MLKVTHHPIKIRISSNHPSVKLSTVAKAITNLIRVLSGIQQLVTLIVPTFRILLNIKWKLKLRSSRSKFKCCSNSRNRLNLESKKAGMQLLLYSEMGWMICLIWIKMSLRYWRARIFMVHLEWYRKGNKTKVWTCKFKMLNSEIFLLSSNLKI